MLSTTTRLNLDKEEIYRLAFGVHYEDALHDRRPLSKMKKDILIELGIMPAENEKEKQCVDIQNKNQKSISAENTIEEPIEADAAQD